MSRGRVGLWPARTNRAGMMRLTTVGRRSGRERSVLVGYIEDGSNLVTVAMNGWADPEPAWWLNLQADPVATVELAGARRTVRAYAAEGDERSRLWGRLRQLTPKLDAYAALRSRQSAVVILVPEAETTNE